MPTLTIPQTIATKAHALSIRCESNRRFAIVQLVANHTKTHKGNNRPKVLKRSDSRFTIAAEVRRLGGYSYVFSLKTGDLIWNNSASEWSTVEQAILNYTSSREA
jgi:hypothetical protein